jgi:DNA-binding NarL/FixJ family response regulator
MLGRDASPEQIDAALRAVAAGLAVRLAENTRPVFGALAEPEQNLLTPREVEVLAAIGNGLSNKAVARQLGISQHTVKFHVEALLRKLGAASRAEAVHKGLRQRLIEM